jgi:hypothetical protein
MSHQFTYPKVIEIRRVSLAIADSRSPRPGRVAARPRSGRRPSSGHKRP